MQLTRRPVPSELKQEARSHDEEPVHADFGRRPARSAHGSAATKHSGGNKRGFGSSKSGSGSGKSPFRGTRSFAPSR